MAVATRGSSGGYLQRAPSPSGLADVLNVILDKGIVIDAWVRISLIGIELITIDLRIVIASVDTYLRYAEAVNRLTLGTEMEEGRPKGLPSIVGGEGDEDGQGLLEGAKQRASDVKRKVRS